MDFVHTSRKENGNNFLQRSQTFVKILFTEMCFYVFTNVYSFTFILYFMHIYN